MGKDNKCFFDKVTSYIYTCDNCVMPRMKKKEYEKTFIKGRSKKDIRETYEKVWSAKNFEIENYWKRANYFWVFQVTTFAGYFTFLASEQYPKHTEILYFVTCIGIIASFAWHFTNKGSKVWQRNWEIHTDMLENYVTGPLYKTVTAQKTYSVSKINEIVSRFFITIWFLIGIKYWNDNVFIPKTIEEAKVASICWMEITSTLITIYFFMAMKFGYGRGRFSERKISFYKRKMKIK